ncbi:MAG: AMP-binding enzyme [Oscillospiraceae bacterium]
MLCNHDTPEPQRFESVGLPHAGVEIRITNPETNAELPAGKQGSIYIRGYLAMGGYYNKPEANQRVFAEEGWMDTGDAGYVDEMGHLYITGRNKELINRGGEKIYPKEIEHFLIQQPAIRDVQVIGVPSDKYGEEVMACVILHEGKTMTNEEIRQLVKENFAYYKVPKYVHFISSYPLTASGKVQKFKLRSQIMQNENWHEVAAQ